MGQEELEQMTEVYNMLVAYLVNHSFQIFGAVVVLVLGVFVGRRLSNLVLALCAKKSLDITLSRFFASSARIAIIFFSVLIALPKLGIQVTPFLAAVGALGLGAGLAVQGLLSNYGAGSASSLRGHLWLAIRFAFMVYLAWLRKFIWHSPCLPMKTKS